MALAQIIDLEEARRARRSPQTETQPVSMAQMPMWFVYWMPVYWYVG